jgi:hypothetical protein
LKYLDAAGYVMGLMKIMTTAEVPLPLRQAASIQFKTLVNSRWVYSSSIFLCFTYLLSFTVLPLHLIFLFFLHLLISSIDIIQTHKKKRQLTVEEKNLVKQNIIELVVHVPPVVRYLLYFY